MDYIYPVIKDIFEEIYSLIILRKDFHLIINNNSLDRGGKGVFFEKIVIHLLTPGESIIIIISLILLINLELKIFIK